MVLIGFIIAVAGLMIVVPFIWRYPVAFANIAIAAAVLCDLTEFGTTGVQLGITIYPLDISCMALIASCVSVWLRTRSSPRDLCWPALILLGLAVLNFIRGVVLFGVKSPGNEARDLIYLVLPAVTFSFMGQALEMDVDRLIRYLRIACIGFALIAAARWAGVMPTPDVYDGQDRDIIRVLPSDYAAIIAQALIGVLGLQLKRGFRLSGMLMVGLLAGLIFALQHRSVWSATSAGLIWLAIWSPRLQRREWLKFTVLGLWLGAAVVISPLVASGPYERAVRLFSSNIQEVNQEDSTWEWRVEGYLEAIQRVFSNGPVEAILGPPSGRDLTNKVKTEASIHIHDRYIQAVAFYGSTGLLVLLIWLLNTELRIQRLTPRPHDRNGQCDKVILESLLVFVVIYFVPYSGGQLEGVLLGAIWLASSIQHGRTREMLPAAIEMPKRFSYAWSSTGVAFSGPVPGPRS